MRGLVLVGLVGLALLLTGCGEASGARAQDRAGTITDQLPGSSVRESPSTWIADFERKGQTGGGEGNVTAPTWWDGEWADWGPSSVAYAVAERDSKVDLEIALLAVVTSDEPTLSGHEDASYMCIQVVLTPGVEAVTTGATCPDEVRERAIALSQALPVHLDGTIHSRANG